MYLPEEQKKNQHLRLWFPQMKHLDNASAIIKVFGI